MPVLTLDYGLLVEAEGFLAFFAEEQARVPDAQGKDGEDDEAVEGYVSLILQK